MTNKHELDAGDYSLNVDFTNEKSTHSAVYTL
jgi:hypothetical protein